MPERHLLAIPLPHGRDHRTGFLTVYLAPRLREGGALRSYPEWARWATTVTTTLSIDVMVDGVLRPSTRVAPLADPAVWDAVFSPDTPVSGHRPMDWRSVAKDVLKVGPGGDFSKAILGLYASLPAAFPDRPPPGDTAVALPAASVLTDPAMAAAADYVAPMTDEDGELLTEARDPEWDFHRYVSILGHHPELLRLLGLAVDLEVDVPPSPSTVRVHTNYDDAGDRRAVDFLMHTTPDFWPRESPNPDHREQDDGFLRLAEQDAFLTSLDVLSSAGRLQGLEERLPGGEGTLPALRTRALTLVRPDLVAAFRNRTERQWEIEEDIRAALGAANPQPVEIFAEDVAIGHRIDVMEPEGDGVWRSLFQRQTDAYRFPRDPALDRVPAPDEGWTTTTLVTEVVEAFAEPNPDVDGEFVPYAARRLDDQLYRWDGWSGAVRPPGGAAEGATGGIAPKQPTEPPPAAPVQFAARYRVVPGSLPRLRFGHRYLMRARCVDLSGDSRPLSAPVPKSALPPAETFGRLEPIAAPLVVRRRPRPVPAVGDDAKTVVLRSDYDVDDATVEGGERLLFPGQVAQDVCELHGVPEGGVDADSYRLLRARDARSPADGWETDAVTGEPVAAGRGSQPVRYLSDPLIGGRLRAHLHATGEERIAALEGIWPAVRSARLAVLAGPAAVEANPDPRTTLRVAIPKAEITTVDLSYAPADLEQFCLWHQLDPAEQDAVRTAIENGGHWMFSARAPVGLIHAVRRPLLAPRVAPGEEDGGPGSWAATRTEGGTGVTISATFEIDRRSTGRVRVAARWTDLVDDPRRPGPEPREGGAPLGVFLTPRDETGPARFTVAEHEAQLGDTRRHAATIELEAFSSFSAYFTEERNVVLEDGATEVDPRGFAPGTVAVRGSAGATAEGVDHTVDEAAGTVAVVAGGALLPGDEVTVRFVPLPVSRTNVDPAEAIPPFEVVFPSTAPPPAPGVVEVVRAFARTRSDVDGGTELVHDGRVVRVYLARPWNVSGDGECLAVLVERAPAGVPAGSCVGRDPLVTGSTTPLTAAAFTRSLDVVPSPDSRYDLALHGVTYDAGSERWFADVAVDTPMYRPFLRLVVARYQADSLPGLELGAPVTLDPVRLGVDRSVSVRPVPDAPESFDVTVTGPDHGGFADDVGGGLLESELVVVHQEASPTILDKELRWQIEAGRVTLSRTTANGVGTWSGRIEALPTGAPRRLVLEEREPALVGGAAPVVTGEVVYTEAVVLP